MKDCNAMRMKIKILLAALLALACFGAAAQTTIPSEIPGGKSFGSSGKSSLEKMLDSRMDTKNSMPYGYRNYSDDKLDEMDKRMKDRAWMIEDTAWDRACELDNKESYQRYSVMYPNGAHVAQANCKLIDFKIAETLANAHSELPNIKHTEEDEDSPESTLVIQNNTGMILTVYYSGDKSDQIVIQPDAVATVTIDNGPYKLAAFVPNPRIRPYAGKTSFNGGRYEIGFWIVSY